MTSALDQLKAIKARLQAAQEAHAADTQAVIDAHHPLQLGDVVSVYAYGRNGVKMRVDRRYVRTYFHGFQWRATGPLLRADGRPGKQQGEWEAEI